LRSQRRSLAAASEEASHPDRYFDPAVKKMIEERRSFVSQVRKSYPTDINSRGLAYAEASQRMRKMAAAHTNELQNEPFSRREIDKHLSRKITLMAEDGVADLYNYALEVWATRVRKWNEKFDREAFCRHCVKLFQSLKITKRIERLVRDVKEAENKDKAFRDSEQALKREISDMKARVFNLHCPWIWTRMWRNLFPYVSSLRVCQEIDRIVDPDIAHFAKVQ
jgi:hypothetical protein